MSSTPAVPEPLPVTTSRLVTTLLGGQALAFGALAVAVLSGAGIGSLPLRIGVGILLVVLGAVAAGLAMSAGEGQPAAPGAAGVFEAFVLFLVLLWAAPLPALVIGAIGVAVLAVTRAQNLRPVSAR